MTPGVSPVASTPAKIAPFGARAVRAILLAGAAGCAILTLPVAWATRYSISTDGVSYLDMAHRAQLPNAYWSPGYPAVLAAVFALGGGNVHGELALAHITQWFIAAAVYLAFAYFVYNLVEWARTAAAGAFRSRIGLLSFVAIAFTMVLLPNVDPNLWQLYPDMLLEAAVFAIAGLCVRLSRPGARLRHYAVLGAMLAAGYMVKAALFPLAFALLGILLLWPVERKHGRKGPAVAAAVFLVASSPLIAGLSYAKRRPTFGEVGRINYVWMVNGLSRYALFDPAGPAWKDLQHHPERIGDAPPVFRLESVAGTIPLWYDPSYWHDGLHPRLEPKRAVLTLLGNIGFGWPLSTDGTTLRAALRPSMPVLAAILACFLAGIPFLRRLRALSTHIWLFAWSAAAILMFATVVIQTRYLTPFLVTMFVGLVLSAFLLNARFASGAMLAASAWLLIAGSGMIARPRPTRIAGNPPLDPEQTYRKLRALGIGEGDRLATAGSAYIPASYYAARLAGARFTFAIFLAPDAAAKLPEPQVRNAEDALRAHGAKAILSAARPGFANDTGWVPLTGDSYIRLLR